MWEKSHHLFQPSAPHGSPLIYEQPEGLGFCGLQLLLLWENYGVEVWQRLGLELGHLRLQRQHDWWFPSIVLKSEVGGLYAFTSSNLFSSNFFSFSALLSCSLSSNENGQTSTWRFSGNWGWNGRPKWGTGGTFICGGCLTWGTF